MSIYTFSLSAYLDCVKKNPNKKYCKHLKSLFPDLLDLYGDPVRRFFETCLENQFVFDELEKFVLNPLVRYRLVLKVPQVSTSSVTDYEVYMMPGELLELLASLAKDPDWDKLRVLVEEFVAASIVSLQPKKSEAEELIEKIVERSSIKLNYDNIFSAMERFINSLSMIGVTSKFNRSAAGDSPLFIIFNYTQFNEELISWINRLTEAILNL